MTYSPAAATTRRPPPTRRRWSLKSIWHDAAFRGFVAQALVIITVLGVGVYMVGNAQSAMEKRGITTGFAFLFEEAGFSIGDSLISFSSTDTFLRAYGVAILNTLKVSAISLVIATLVGVLLGIMRLSKNVLIAKFSSAYVELFRNTPQLLQIVFWYMLVIQLPHPKQALALFDVAFLSNRGLLIAWPTGNPVHVIMALAFLVGCIGTWQLVKWADRKRRQTGKVVHVIWWNISLILGLPIISWVIGGMPTDMDIPKFQGFNFRGGVGLTPEFLALFLGLSLYIAAFIAEIVRSGIQSVSKGQIEAATSVGLGPVDIFRKVIYPQALRVMVPPATAQYVSLIKNSSLGVAIGYPELFNVNNIILTASGNTIEAIGIMMVVYLTIAFSIAILMNIYNKSVQIQER